MDSARFQALTVEDPPAGFRIVNISGPLVLRTVMDFQNAARGENALGLILDLSSVDFMDSAGLGALLGIFASYKKKGKRLALVGVNARLETLFEITHTDQFLQCFATVDDAKAGKG